MIRTTPPLKIQSIKQTILNREKPSETELSRKIQLIGSGSTLFNLACSDCLEGAFGVGKIVNIIGDPSSGKTLMALSIFAEACISPHLSSYKLIYDDAECANEFDMGRLFGRETVKRIETISSDTIQTFYVNVKKYLDKKKPFIYILDSLDALTSEEELDHLESLRKARSAGKTSKGTYDLSKQKFISKILRDIVHAIKDTQSLLIVISQTRDNISPISFEPKTRAGGRALRFYCSHEVWLAVKRKIKKSDLPIGVQVRAKITKNKLTGKLREVEFPILYDYGIDDLRSCIEYLIETETWKENKGIITDGAFTGSIPKVIKTIEADNKEEYIRNLVKKIWDRIEDSIKSNRKPKYQ